MDTDRSKHVMMEEYAGIIGGIKFFWRFRCVKLRAFMEIWGLISTFAFGTMMLITTIVQWYVPGHEINMLWNVYNEAFIEYIFALISLPCILYFFKVSLRRLRDGKRHRVQMGIST